MTPNSAYQSGMNTPEMQGRMGTYEPNKDPFGTMRKGELTTAEWMMLSQELKYLCIQILNSKWALIVNAFPVGEQFLPANQGPNSGVGDQQPQTQPQQQPPFNRGPPGAMGTMPMGPRQQYPYGPGYDRR